MTKHLIITGLLLACWFGGLWIPELRADEGRLPTLQASAAPSNRDGADAQIRVLWETLKRALMASDVEGAIRLFISNEQERYRTLFQAARDHLPRMAQEMEEIELIYIADDVAKYRLRRTQIIQNQPTRVSYYIYFFRLPEGAWRIDSF